MKTWIEISKNNLVYNFNLFSNLAPKSKIIAIIKANAYGHDLEAVARILMAEPSFRKKGCFGVDSLAEALVIKKTDYSGPIIILGFTSLAFLEQVVINNFEPVVYSEATIKKLEELGRQYNKEVRVHLKLETGTNRQGVGENELIKLIAQLKRTPHLRLAGVYSHFANVEEDQNFSRQQFTRFNDLVRMIKDMGVDFDWRHMSSSAAILNYPEVQLEAVRLGLSLYGLYSIQEVKFKKLALLRPVLTWKTVVAQVKKIDQGETVGYGQSWQAKRKTTMAVLPIGYADGYDRGLGNRGSVIVRGKKCPIIGRICMNMCMADVTGVPKIDAGDEVTLIGGSREAKVTADQLAKILGTINYEIVARINPLIPRIII